MTILTTENQRTGVRRYFIDGRRTTRDRVDAAMLWRRLECFRTTTHGGVTRHYCEAR